MNVVSEIRVQACRLGLPRQVRMFPSIGGNILAYVAGPARLGCVGAGATPPLAARRHPRLLSPPLLPSFGSTAGTGAIRWGKDHRPVTVRRRRGWLSRNELLRLMPPFRS